MESALQKVCEGHMSRNHLHAFSVLWSTLYDKLDGNGRMGLPSLLILKLHEETMLPSFCIKYLKYAGVSNQQERSL